MDRNQRQKKLIEIIINANAYITVKRCAEILGVSQRTVHYELKKIEENYPELQLLKKPGLGIKILVNENIISNDQEELRLKQVARLLVIDQEKVTIDKLSQQFFVSQTSIMLDLQRIQNLILVNTQAQLVSDNFGTRVVAKEYELQKCIQNYNKLFHIKDRSLDEIKDSLKNEFDPAVVMECYALVCMFPTFNLFCLAPHYLNNIFSAMVVMVSRLMMGKTINHSIDVLKIDEILAMKHFLIALDIFNRLSEKLSFEFFENDVTALSIYLQANRLEFRNTNPHIYRESIDELTKKMILEVEYTSGFSITNDDELFQNVSMHMYHMMYRINNKIFIKNPLIQQIKNEFRDMFDVMWMIVEKCVGQGVTEDEVGFLLLHFQQAIDKIQQSKRILVVCTNGLVASNYIINRIKSAVRSNDKIEISSAPLLNKDMVEHIDLIISTQILPNFGIPTVVVSPLITEMDIKKINQLYPYLKKIEPEVDDCHSKFIFDKDLIFLNQPSTSKQEIIEFLVNQMMVKNLVTDKFIGSVLEREKKGSTELLSKAAMPHGNPDWVNTTSVGIYTMKKPTKWDKEFVNVVILIAIAKQDIHNCKQLLSRLFNLVKTYDRTVKLIHLSRQELLNKLMENTNDN